MEPWLHEVAEPLIHGAMESHGAMVSNLQGDEGEQLGRVGGANQGKSSFSFAQFLSCLNLS